MPEQSFDLVVIGAGPGGYVCAIRAAQLGLSVACIDKGDKLGGTCLNVGCIPSKALLHSSEMFAQAGHGLAVHGVKVAGVELDLAQMMEHKKKVVAGNVSGVAFLFKKNKVEWVKGVARLAGTGAVSVKPTAGPEVTLKAKHIVIATGSEVTTLAGVIIDEKRIVSSTGALELQAVPKRLIVIGAGYIGLELGSVWKRLGAEVTVVEYLDRILPGMDAEVAGQMQRVLARQGIAFKLGCKVTGAKATNQGVAVAIEPAQGGAPEQLNADVVLVAIGRRALTAGLGLREAGVALDERGRIATDARFSTNLAGIYVFVPHGEHVDVRCAIERPGAILDACLHIKDEAKPQRRSARPIP